jgi:hypothetical protein
MAGVRRVMTRRSAREPASLSDASARTRRASATANARTSTQAVYSWSVLVSVSPPAFPTIRFMIHRMNGL